MSNEPAPASRIDPNVKIPDSVRLAAERAAAIHDAAYKAAQAPEPAPEPPQPQPDPAPEPPQPQPEPAPQPKPQPQPQPQPEPPAPEPQREPTRADAPSDQQWHAYLSMRGRYNQAQQTIGAMQEQLQQLGDELIRTQRLLTQPAPQPQPVQPRKLVTDEDVQNYGPDLLNLVQRAAMEAVSPELEAVKQENNELRQTVNQTKRSTVHQVLDDQVPDWRIINRDQRFLRWLSLPDIYSGELRRNLLSRAFSAADAPRVVRFFKGFLDEEQATGHVQVPPGQPPAKPAPRHAAVQLETLAAPGRAKPTGGEVPLAADKPVYTRKQIAAFYKEVNAGLYVGRKPEKDRIEADIFAAQREGRVR